jgi:AcrR family transcriptional regulator
MGTIDMSLRKEKAALLKYHILEVTLAMIGKKSFEDVYVDDICEKVKISKVTLFKYFPQKEDILLYYFRVWCLKRSVEFVKKPIEGVAGIYHIADKLAEDFDARPGMLLSLMAYLSDYNRSPKPFPLKSEEKKLFFPDIPTVGNVEILSLDQMIEKFVLEAILKREITKSTSTRDIANSIVSILYGGMINAHIQQLSPAKIFFRRNVDMVLKGIQ